MKTKYLYGRMTDEQREHYNSITDPDEKKRIDAALDNQFFHESEGKQLAEKVSKMVNSGWSDDEITYFIRRMAYEHRTLQQNFTRLCVAWFKDLKTRGDKGCFDGRNQASVELAQAIFENCDDKVHLPFI